MDYIVNAGKNKEANTEVRAKVYKNRNRISCATMKCDLHIIRCEDCFLANDKGITSLEYSYTVEELIELGRIREA